MTSSSQRACSPVIVMDEAGRLLQVSLVLTIGTATHAVVSYELRSRPIADVSARGSSVH